MKTIWVCVVSGAATIALVSRASAACSPADFFDRNDYKEDVAIQLSLAWNWSESEFNKRKQNAGLTVPIQGVPVSGSWGDFREAIRKKAGELKIDRFEQRAIAYATSVLSGTGLDAYKACLKAERGDFKLWLAKPQSVEYHHLQLFYEPAKISGKERWRIVSVANIDTKSEAVLRDEISKAPDASHQLDYNILLKPQDGRLESQVTIRLENVTHSIVFPPLPRRFKEVVRDDELTQTQIISHTHPHTDNVQFCFTAKENQRFNFADLRNLPNSHAEILDPSIKGSGLAQFAVDGVRLRNDTNATTVCLYADVGSKQPNPATAAGYHVSYRLRMKIPVATIQNELCKVDELADCKILNK